MKNTTHYTLIEQSTNHPDEEEKIIVITHNPDNPHQLIKHESIWIATAGRCNGIGQYKNIKGEWRLFSEVFAWEYPPTEYPKSEPEKTDQVEPTRDKPPQILTEYCCECPALGDHNYCRGCKYYLLDD